jgi:hypothetical protein
MNFIFKNAKRLARLAFFIPDILRINIEIILPKAA